LRLDASLGRRLSALAFYAAGNNQERPLNDKQRTFSKQLKSDYCNKLIPIMHDRFSKYIG